MTDITLRSPADAEQFRMKVGRYGDRHYFDPLPADDVWPQLDPNEPPYPSVSTIKKVTARDFSYTAAQRVAEYAVNTRDAWSKVADDNPAVAVTLLAGANQRGLSEAGARGTAVHGVMENLAAGRDGMLHIDASAIPYLEGCKAFLHDCKPVFLYNEIVAVSRTQKYGGTLDCILEIAGKRYLVDWKSRKAGGHAAYIEEAWQVAAYAKADYYIVANEQGLPVRVTPPELDGGLIVSLCPGEDSYKVYPVDIEKGWAGFVQMRRLWEATHSDLYKPLGKPAELCPRAYKLVLPPPPAAQDKAPAATQPPWDPFGGLPTGDVVGTVHELVASGIDKAIDMPGAAAVTAAIHDNFVSTWRTPTTTVAPTYVLPPPITWVEARWMQPQEQVRGQDGSMLIIPAVEQRMEGWYIEQNSDGHIILADDSGNQTTITAPLSALSPAEHPHVGVIPIGAGQAVEGAAVEPEVPTAPPVPASVPEPSSAAPAPAGGQDGGDEYRLVVRSWLRRRLAADIEQLGGQSAALRYWPPGARVLDEAGKNDHFWEELDAIEQALTNLEKDMHLPFGETKPQLLVEKPEPVRLSEMTSEAVTVENVDKPAHPDDVERVKARAVEVQKMYPKTFDLIQAEAGRQKIRGFRFEPTADHMRRLNDIIDSYVLEVEGRIAGIESLYEGVNADMKVLIAFAIGPDSTAAEPTENDFLAVQLLTSAAISRMLEISDQGELLATEGLMEKARETYPERVQLFRAVNPFLTDFGFSTVNSLESLRRRPLGIVLMLHAEETKIKNQEQEQEYGHAERE